VRSNLLVSTAKISHAAAAFRNACLHFGFGSLAAFVRHVSASLRHSLTDSIARVLPQRAFIAFVSGQWNFKLKFWLKAAHSYINYSHIRCQRDNSSLMRPEQARVPA
jgi:hypothetical protein